MRYRAYVDRAMEELITNAPARLSDILRPLIELGLHHEQQHQELVLMDIKHAFSINPLLPSYAQAMEREPSTAPPPEWVAYPGGLYEIGMTARASPLTMKARAIASGWSRSRWQTG